MCGRFISGADEITWREYCEILRLHTVPSAPISGDMRPTQKVSVFRHNDEKKEVELVRCVWGLLPHWAKEKKEARKLFNVRSETVRHKFRLYFEKKRCVIPALGFYEWQKAEKRKKKIQHIIHDKKHRLLSFAGIWSRWLTSDDEPIETCSILTTAASAKVARVHHRMPVILQAESLSLWLDPDSDASNLTRLFLPYDSDTFIVESLEPLPADDGQGKLF